MMKNTSQRLSKNNPTVKKKKKIKMDIDEKKNKLHIYLALTFCESFCCY